MAPIDLDDLLKAENSHVEWREGEVTPFLQRPCSKATLDDLDLVIAREFLRPANLPHPPEEYLKPGARLDAFSYPLVLPSGSRAVPTYLALLLFSREPTRWIPGAHAIFAVYPGEERTDAQSVRFQANAPLPSLIRDLLLERLQLYTGISIDKSRSALEIRQNRLRYSSKALQEAWSMPSRTATTNRTSPSGSRSSPTESRSPAREDPSWEWTPNNGDAVRPPHLGAIPPWRASCPS